MRHMKDSGIEWIGEMPISWNYCRVKYNTYLKGRIGWQGLKASEFIDEGPYLVTGTDFENGCVDWSRCYHISNERFNEAPEIHLKKDDLLITKDGTVGKLAYINNLPGSASLNSHLLVIRPTQDIYINKYLYWILSSSVFDTYNGLSQNGTIMASLSQEKINNFSFAVPSIPEQKLIADFLDQKCTAIKSIIEKQQAVIEKLKSYKQSVITEAVTKGLNPDVPMKDSGIEWIGEIPEHWNVVRIKSLFQIVNVRNESDENAVLLSLFTAIGVKPRSEMEDKGNKAVTVINYKKVEEGDLIVNKLLAWMGAIAYSDYQGVTSPDYDVYRAYKEANVVQGYYHHYFRDTKFKDDCYKYGHGIMMMRWRTYPDEFKSIPVINPPREEQVKIARYVVDTANSIDRIISRKQDLVDKLSSYKKSLIYEAVTGKLEIAKCD